MEFLEVLRFMEWLFLSFPFFFFLFFFFSSSSLLLIFLDNIVWHPLQYLLDRYTSNSFGRKNFVLLPKAVFRTPPVSSWHVPASSWARHLIIMSAVVLNNQQSSLPWIVLGGSIGLMGGLVLYSSCVQQEEEERLAPRPEPVWGLTRRFTNGQVCLLEKWYKGGVTRPTRAELEELSQVIGKTGAHGLLLSRNMIRLWFQERLER